MAILSYNISPKIETQLNQCETLRNKILLTPISPKNLIRLRWETNIAKTYWSLNLSGEKFSKNEIARILASQNKKRLSSEKKEIINYKSTLDHLEHEWLVTPRKITASSLMGLYEIALKPTIGSDIRFFNSSKEDLEKLMDYLQTGSENPFIQAGIGQIHVLGIGPFRKGNGRISRLFSYLILYKYGYDLRGLFQFDEYLRRDLMSLKTAVESVQRTKNLTFWLEYFSEACRTQLQKTLEGVSGTRFQTELPAGYFRLNDRQREILLYLDEPGASINNKKVQDMFSVSQITASRILAKLTDMSLIFPHGKARSRYYTKV